MKQSVLVSASILLVFAFAAAAWTAPRYQLTTLAMFGGNTQAGLIFDANGNLYGTTYSGGENFTGTVFEVATGTRALSTLAPFGVLVTPSTSNGNFPTAGLIFDANGNLYGTTSAGGSSEGDGTVFELAAGTHVVSTLVKFNVTNGQDPEAGLIFDSSGNLYGTTRYGGANNVGTVFKVAAGTHALTTLATFNATFNGTNGASPRAGLIADASGNLYGTASSGGANNAGTVFKVAAGTHALTTLATFNGANGSNPAAGLIADANGNLYGTTVSGGDLALNSGSGYGTVFELAAGTHSPTTLATFDGTNGAYPYGGLIADASGNLYGTTYSGGDLTLNYGEGLGTVFELAAGTHTLSTLATFNGANGSNPTAGLIFDANGNLYGTTSYGTVFELSPVPEPPSIALAVLSFLGLFAHCGRKNK